MGIERVHMEEDTGKSMHVGGATGRIHGADYSLVDYNRAGIPLVEIVTKPITGTGALAPEVARAYVTELRDVLRSLGVSDVRMEEGSLRCDVNTSIAPIGSAQLGHPDRDQERQLAALGRAGRPVRDPAPGRRCWTPAARIAQETRHFHEDTGITTSGRSKEEAEDYRYFPEPDLVPLAPSREWVEQIRRTLPELPSARRQRLQAEWGLSDLATWPRCATRRPSTWWRTPWRPAPPQPTPASGGWASCPGGPTRPAPSWPRWPITPAQVARVAELVASGTLNDKLARQVLDGVLAGEGDPDRCGQARGLAVVSDDSARSPPWTRPSRPTRTSAQKIRDGKVAAAGRPDRRGHEGHPRPGRRRPRPRADPGTPQLAPPHALV